jgi:diguanylate cyclase (GGDEF)-like protein
MQPNPERRRQLVEIERRSWHLWAISLSITGGLTFGITLLLYPALEGYAEHLEFERHYLPQLVYGLFILVVLAESYFIMKQRELNALRNFIIASYASSAANAGNYATDALTGALDRSALVELLKTESTRAEKTNAKFCVVIFDIWDFKSFNLREGNLVGDLMLKELALLLMRTIRKADWVMRYGPDEFLCLLEASPRPGGDAFVQRVEKMRVRVDRLHGVKLLVGLAEYKPGDDAERVVSEAERELRKGAQAPASAASVPA